MALETAKERVREAAATGAEVLMTSCPFCVTNFGDAVKAFKEEQEQTGVEIPEAKIEVVELLELLDQLL